MKMEIIIFGMLAVLITSQACRDKCAEGERGNPFIAMPIIIKPSADTVSVGDTLILSISIPFDNTNLRNGNNIDIRNSSISNFGIDYSLYIKLNDTLNKIEGLTNFKIIYERGGVNVTDVGVRHRFEKDPNRFIFIAKLIPLKKGLVRIANYRAEGEMDKGCVLNDFIPSCGNLKLNHELFFDFYKVPYNINYTKNYPNHYYFWVR